MEMEIITIDEISRMKEIVNELSNHYYDFLDDTRDESIDENALNEEDEQISILKWEIDLLNRYFHKIENTIEVLGDKKSSLSKKDEMANITTYNNKNGVMYEVKITRAGVQYCQTFKDLETAKRYKERVFNHAKRKNYDYPMELINRIFEDEINDEKLDMNYIINNIDDNLETLLQISPLKQRYIDAFKLYFKEGLTYESASYCFGVTRERVSHYIEHAIRILKMPCYRKYLKYGYNYVCLQDNVEQLERDLEQKYYDLQIELKNHLKNKIDISHFMSQKIDVLDLSVRTYNCLHRAMLLTIGEVIEFTEKSDIHLMKIRNLGPKSRRELCEKFEENFGFKLKDIRYGRCGNDSNYANEFFDKKFGEDCSKNEPLEE